MKGDLYTLRYRHGNAGIQNVFVEANSQEMAEVVGRHFVNQKFNALFIKVEPAVVATEDALPAAILREYILSRMKTPATDVEPDDDTKGPLTPRAPKERPAPPVDQTGDGNPVSAEESKRRELALVDEETRDRLLAEQEEAKEDAEARARKRDGSESNDPPKVIGGPNPATVKGNKGK